MIETFDMLHLLWVINVEWSKLATSFAEIPTSSFDRMFHTLNFICLTIFFLSSLLLAGDKVFPMTLLIIHPLAVWQS